MSSLGIKLKLKWRAYAKTLKTVGLKLPPIIWILFAFVLAVFGFVAVFVFFDNLVLSIVTLLVIFSVVIGFPIYKEESKVAEIEKHLPNALKEMADILKSGGTYEYALREITILDFGPLSKEFEQVLIRLEEGYNIEESLVILAENINSELVKKIIGIVIDALKSGGGLADVLEEISEDARQIHKLNLDRKAKTTMQTMFIFAAGALIAPAIFGLVTTLIEFLISVSSTASIAAGPAIAKATAAKDTIINALIVFLFVEAIASSFMISMMRDSKIAKIFLYIPIFLFIAYLVYYVALYFTRLLLIGLL
jgi:archaeal flagellar protein FlaJ